MRERVDEIVEALRAALASGTVDEHTFPRALQSVQALAPQTELDRVHHLSGYLRLIDTVFQFVPAVELQPLVEQRANVAALLQRQYGSEQAPYLRSRSIVASVAARLAAGDDTGEAVAAAAEELESLDFDEADASAGTLATVAVHALRVAHDWLAAHPECPPEADPYPFMLWMLADILENGGFDRGAVLKAAEVVRAGRFSLDSTPLGHASALMVVLGFGLRANPSALPALDPVFALVVEAIAEANQPTPPGVAEPVPANAAEPAPPDFAARCEAILATFERGLLAEGFSEHLVRQTIADFQELEPGSEDEGHTLREAMVRMYDLAIPYAPPEAAQTFQVGREAILQQDAPPQPPLDAAAVRTEMEAVMQRLRDELAGGGLPSPAVMRAMTAVQALGLRIRDEDALKVMMRLMPEIVAIVAPYAEPDKALIAEDVAQAMGAAFGDSDALLSEDSTIGKVAGHAMMREMKRLAQTITADPYEQLGALPHQRQLAFLIRPFMDRVVMLRTLPEAGPRDAAEAERISKRAEIAFNRVRAATTEAQWIEGQRRSLRRVAVELRQFERRHHLMLIRPPWPTHAVLVDANAVFFSGTPAVREVVESGCARIGMEAPIAHGVDDPTHTRWDLMRRSAIAVFDFTTYDRALADPPGALPRSRDKQEAIARAAAPVARVAYEYGWALVLGAPTVALTREGQVMPFDIDIEPVHIAGDDGDAMRVVLGLQAALFGVQRRVHTTHLGATFERFREHFADDAAAAPLLDALTNSRDAMQLHLTAEALLERTAGRGMMLALPTLPPVYPRSNEPRTVFHVTAFRPWSKPCEETVREACTQAGIEYRIGYERLDRDIVPAIWHDIAIASYVIADLTNLNPNAVLELSIAHALGRPTLVLTQTPDLPAHLPALAKVRTHTYATDAAGRLVLVRLIERYFHGDSAA